MLLRSVFYSLNPKLRRFVRRLWFLPLDVYKSIAGKREVLVPPHGLIFTGAGDFKKIGDRLVKSFIQNCHLSPDDKVLDIGCGIGRIARPLTAYLSRKGTYFGFDIVKLGVDWCKDQYIKYPNFHFQYIPLKNDLYNLSTDKEPSLFTFPYDNDSFDLIVLVSVFTHMQEADVKRYIQEISRVLKPGKYCFCTFFVITQETDAYLNNSKEPFFKYRYNNYFLHDAKVKDANISYKYRVIEEMISSSNLTIEKLLPGWWAGRKKENHLDFQDVLILKK